MQELGKRVQDVQLSQHGVNEFDAEKGVPACKLERGSIAARALANALPVVSWREGILEPSFGTATGWFKIRRHRALHIYLRHGPWCSAAMGRRVVSVVAKCGCSNTQSAQGLWLF
eukprot:5397959-Pleurochrysis_carterae.AAC.1